MRYGNPSIDSALKDLQSRQVRRLLVLPLYPQYCAATTGSTFDEVTNILQKWRWIPELRIINQYFEEENREYFMEAGGEQYKYIPCLNDDQKHLNFISNLVLKHTQGWNIS